MGDKMTVKFYLKELRIKKGWTIYKLSKVSGVSTSEISKIENGIKTNPQIKTISKLCKAFDIDISNEFFSCVFF